MYDVKDSEIQTLLTGKGYKLAFRVKHGFGELHDVVWKLTGTK